MKHRKHYKKLAVILASVMVLSSMSILTGAAATTQADDTTQSQQTTGGSETPPEKPDGDDGQLRLINRTAMGRTCQMEKRKKNLRT